VIRATDRSKVYGLSVRPEVRYSRTDGQDQSCYWMLLSELRPVKVIAKSIFNSVQCLYIPESQSDTYDDLFNVNIANHGLQQASTRPVSKMLFGKLWFEHELYILFTDSKPVNPTLLY
jgi:hypothetical protein